MKPKQSEMELGVKFKPPTLEQVKVEASVHFMDEFEAEKFYSYHQAGGWMIGRNKMKSWRDALNLWRLKATYKEGPKRSRTVYELTKIIEAKKEIAEQLKRQYSSESALGRQWDKDSERKEYVMMMKQIKEMTIQLAGM